MFVERSSFNQPTWGLGRYRSVTDMSNMFSYAPSFNQPLGTGTYRSVTDMSHMFLEPSFNQYLPTGTCQCEGHGWHALLDIVLSPAAYDWDVSGEGHEYYVS
jgi:hypothetical protein